MNYEFCHKGKNIVKYGDYGDKFYMIIKGKVNVLIPKNFRVSSVQ